MANSADSYHMVGECLDTTLDSIQTALTGGEWSLRLKNDELRIESTGWRLEVYESSPDEFLFGAEFNLSLQGTKTILESMAKRLTTHGIVFKLSATQNADPSVGIELKHPNYTRF